MQTASVQNTELVLLALAFFVALLATVARKLNIAYPIVMVIGGLFLSLFPQLPRVRLNPDLVFLVVLPPLLFSASYQISWREFRRNLVSIVFLAFGLVGFTVYGVAGISRFMIPGFTWRTGLVLGAVIAATDAIAATATAKRFGLPRSITELLEAESLVNDGSGLVALRFTLALIVTGSTPSFAAGVGTLTYLVAMGILIGIVTGIAVNWVQRRLADSSVEITISLITPFVAYLTAEAAKCSGVLATMACGMYLARQTEVFSLRARIEGAAVWNTLDFVLNGLIFLLLGLQLPAILAEALSIATTRQLLEYGALFSAFIIALRLIYVFPGAAIATWVRTRLLGQADIPFSRPSVFLVGWAGIRGVLALAAAFSLPERLNSGQPFPERSMIIFLSFSVIFTTLVLQGLTMPAMIHALGLARTATTSKELEEARRHMLQSALKRLEEMRTKWGGKDTEVLDRLQYLYESRLLALSPEKPSSPLEQAEKKLLQQLSGQLRAAERAEAYRLCDEGRIDDELLRSLQYELDLRDATQET
jgi:CPA1 family monovalent cation:H+ antiporter